MQIVSICNTDVHKGKEKSTPKMTHTVIVAAYIVQFTEINGDKMNNGLFLCKRKFAHFQLMMTIVVIIIITIIVDLVYFPQIWGPQLCNTNK